MSEATPAVAPPASRGDRGEALVELAAGDAPHGHGDGDHALRVRVAPRPAPDEGEAQIAVRIADPALAAAVTERILAALADAADQLASATAAAELEGATAAAELASATAAAEFEGAAPAPERAIERVIELRSRKALARRGAALASALAVVPVTERNARRLVELVDGIRAAGALGVQLVWDGESPPRELVERHVFAVLERARATPLGPPVVLAADARPAAALRILIAHGRRIER